MSRRLSLLVCWCLFAAGCARAPLWPVPFLHGGKTPVILTPLFREPFDELDPSRWKTVDLTGTTSYTIERQDGESRLKADSQAGASILLTEVRFDPDKFEWLSWRWRVDRLVEREDLASKEGSDASARVYVYFNTPGLLPWQKRAMQYVWSATLPVGTIVTSPYPGHPKMLVVESGAEHLGMWRAVSRNLEDDYERCYGGRPPKVVAIGIMTDSDNTQSEAVAHYDDVRITRASPVTPSDLDLP